VRRFVRAAPQISIRATLDKKPTSMAMKALPLVLLVLFVALADGARDIWADYEHAPTTCEVSNCATGGCLFEDCDRPLSCSGGLCYFR
jgi:hypothetical protein